jgi:hypothetical protein
MHVARTVVDTNRGLRVPHCKKRHGGCPGIIMNGSQQLMNWASASAPVLWRASEHAGLDLVNCPGPLHVSSIVQSFGGKSQVCPNTVTPCRPPHPLPLM